MARRQVARHCVVFPLSSGPHVDVALACVRLISAQLIRRLTIWLSLGVQGATAQNRPCRRRRRRRQPRRRLILVDLRWRDDDVENCRRWMLYFTIVSHRLILFQLGSLLHVYWLKILRRLSTLRPLQMFALLLLLLLLLLLFNSHTI